MTKGKCPKECPPVREICDIAYPKHVIECPCGITVISDTPEGAMESWERHQRGEWR